MKLAVSVSLGSSRRDKAWQGNLDGREIRIERRGADGSLDRFAALFRELDGEADALGVGGADLWLWAGGRRWPFRQVHRLVEGARRTPVVDGSGLKHTLERRAVGILAEEGSVDWSRERVLLAAAIDRFGMAEALEEAGAACVFGDLAFGLGVPIRMRRLAQVRRAAALLLPLVTRLPFAWFYPTGPKQDRRSPRFPALFREATVIAGDWPMIRRFAPDDLGGKTILTQALRRDDLDWLRQAGAARAISTTPLWEGEAFATNAMEAALAALAGRALEPEELAEASARLGWRPTVLPLQAVD